MTPTTGEQKQLRVLVEVHGGILPGQPMPEYTRRFGLYAEQWDAAQSLDDKSGLLAEFNGKASGYAALLMMQPDRLNWVRTEWLWL